MSEASGQSVSQSVTQSVRESMSEEPGSANFLKTMKICFTFLVVISSSIVEGQLYHFSCDLSDNFTRENRLEILNTTWSHLINYHIIALLITMRNNSALFFIVTNQMLVGINYL